MRIALLSHCFHPSVGGIETMTELLAEGFIRAGHEVIVATQTPDDGTRRFGYEVLRKPSFARLVRLARWCDVYVQNNISLATLWPPLILDKPLIVCHATWIQRADGSLSWRDHLKRYLLRHATCISNSKAIADSTPTPSTVIGNPYRDHLFTEVAGVTRDRDIVFLGRLVSDKGPYLLLDALDRLHAQGPAPTVTFIGDGPELSSLRARVDAAGYAPNVTFAGALSGQTLVEQLNRHRIMAVPSVWNEPFGIVALEGAACGCVVVGSSGGGLADAIGPCGPTFPNGDAGALAETLRELLGSTPRVDAYRAAAPAHLRQHTVEAVVERYLDIFRKTIAAA